jgi:AraC-like DNA-binding protein
MLLNSLCENGKIKEVRYKLTINYAGGIVPSQSKIEDDFTVRIEYAVFQKCPQNWSMPEQMLVSCNFTYVITGNARYTVNNKEYNLGPGDLLCLPYNSLLKGSTFPDRLMRGFSVDFYLFNLKGKMIRPPFPIFSHIGLPKDIIRLFYDLSFSWEEKQPGFSIQARGMFFLVLYRLFELFHFSTHISTEDLRIQRAKRYISQHFSKKITIKKLAGLYNLSPVYFGALFKQETGLTVNQYLTRTRLKQGEAMLRSGKYKVTEAAEYCGYADAYQFYKRFRMIRGFPPSLCIPR